MIGLYGHRVTGDMLGKVHGVKNADLKDAGEKMVEGCYARISSRPP